MKILRFLLFLLCFTNYFNLFSQKLINLNVEKMRFSTDFSIENVRDLRPNKENFGSIFVASNEKQMISLKGGIENATRKTLSQIIPNHKSQILLSYNILDFKISETRQSNGTISGQLSLKIAFERIGKRDTVRLTETTTSTTFIRSDNQMPAGKYESIVTSLFTKSLEYIDKWLFVNGGKSEALVKGVKIVFLPETTENTGDTICYHSRKVTWEDFKGKPTNSHYGAAIFTNFAYDASFRIIDGYIVATVQTKTYMVRGMSWVTPAAHDAYSLSHEQLHFDITKLVVERFKKKIAAMQADLVIDLNSMIQFEYLESYREMNKLQNQYDYETQHSINRRIQAEWEEKVAKWLKEVS
jgi:hypothetical protein